MASRLSLVGLGGRAAAGCRPPGGVRWRLPGAVRRLGAQPANASVVEDFFSSMEQSKVGSGAGWRGAMQRRRQRILTPASVGG